MQHRSTECRDHHLLSPPLSLYLGRLHCQTAFQRLPKVRLLGIAMSAIGNPSHLRAGHGENLAPPGSAGHAGHAGRCGGGPL